MVDCVTLFLLFNPPIFLYKEIFIPVNLSKKHPCQPFQDIYPLPTTLKYTPLPIITDQGKNPMLEIILYKQITFTWN